MIINLKKNGVLDIKTMKVPEPVNNFYLQYQYESGTNHLMPRLNINGKIFEGDRKYIDLSDIKMTGKLKFIVELLDGDKVTLRKYTAEIPLYNYYLLGTKPYRPDMELYIKQLEQRVQ